MSAEDISGLVDFVAALKEEISTLKLLLEGDEDPKIRMRLHTLLSQNLQTYSSLYRQPRIFRKRE